jgi:hypothetical protein
MIINTPQKLLLNSISLNILLSLSACLFVVNSQAQDLEPRILASVPTGTNILIASYGYSSGNILLDNSAPIEDLDAELNNVIVAYARSFKLFNKLTKFDAVVPYSFAKFNATLNQIDTSTTRNGFGDPLFRISMLLVGSPPLKPSEFFKHDHDKFKLGVFLRFKVPVGQYNPDKLINLGSNRWAFKTGVAGSYTLHKKIVFEGHLNSWFFTKNTDFFRGNTSYQEPIYGAQFHAGYIFKPGIWVAGSIGQTYGGKTSINGVEQDIDQNNSRYGFTFAYRLAKKHSLKAAFTNGLITGLGSDFTTFLLAYQHIWLDKKASKKKKI